MSTPTMNHIPPTNPSPRGSAKPLNIILAVLGGLVLLTVLISTTREAVATLNTSYRSESFDAQGVKALDIYAASGTFNLEFAPVPEANFEVSTSNGKDWSVERKGETLEVRAPEDWMDFCFLGCAKDNNIVTLTLPQEMNDGSMDAKLKLGAGKVKAEGNFNVLDLDISAGELVMNGAAKDLDATLGAGHAYLELKDVEQADLGVSAGRLSAYLSGAAPQRIDAKVSAGTIQLTVPDVSYAVTAESSSGSVDNELQTSNDSQHRINVKTSAGSAVLYPGVAPDDAPPFEW